MKRIEWLVNKYLAGCLSYETSAQERRGDDSLGRYANNLGSPMEIKLERLGLSWATNEARVLLPYKDMSVLSIKNLESLKNRDNQVFLDVEVGSNNQVYPLRLGGTKELFQDAFSFHKFLSRVKSDPLLKRETDATPQA